MKRNQTDPSRMDVIREKEDYTPWIGMETIELPMCTCLGFAHVMLSPDEPMIVTNAPKYQMMVECNLN